MISKDKKRIAITIHKETKELLDSLLTLHSEGMTYSNLIEISLMYYARAVQRDLDDINNKIEKETKNGKN